MDDRDISRRRFLRLSAFAVPAAPTLLQQLGESRSSSGALVVVVGAGLAGLSAADVLRKAGRPVSGLRFC